MNRFIQTDYNNKEPPNFHDYMNHPLLPLETALAPVLLNINELDDYIKSVKCLCRNPSTHQLTKDESAAVYLYTRERGNQSLYDALNRALRLGNYSLIRPWFGFLKLFITALEKLPTVKGIIWRGIHVDIAKNFKENQEITWWDVSSCSSSIEIIKRYLNKSSIICSIEARHGKNVCDYAHYITNQEVILLPGTRLRVKGNAYDSSIGARVIHLVEMTDSTYETSTSSHTPISSTNNLSKDDSRSTTSTKTYVATAYMATTNVFPEKDDSKKNKVSSVTTFSNGDQYGVIYKNGEKQPYTIFHNSTGEKYEGRSADIRANGVGVRTEPNGDRYEGPFKYGKMNGYGTLSCANGYAYVGNWIVDKAYGKGISTWLNGNRYEGYHENGKIQGHGTFHSGNGDTYEGKLIDGKADGRGIRIWSNGDRYDGSFKNDKKHGNGTYYFKGGGIYTGDWANDDMNGYGKFTWPSGTCYIGAYNDGKRHGKGKLTFVNGQIQNGRWENENFIG